LHWNTSRLPSIDWMLMEISDARQKKKKRSSSLRRWISILYTPLPYLTKRSSLRHYQRHYGGQRIKGCLVMWVVHWLS
jgi:hypothetical protein